MVAFHGKQETKDFYISRVRAHRAAEQLMHGSDYWNKEADGVFRGCAVGCTLHSDDHAAYEVELGIPRLLARLEDSIFESLPEDRAMSWPEEFLEAPEPGADLSMVWPQFAHWLLVDPEWGVLQFAKFERSRASIEGVAALYARKIAGEAVTSEEWNAAVSAAVSAATYAATYVDLTSPAYAEAAEAEADAVYAASYAASYAAAYAAAYAVYAAAHDADSRKKWGIAQADKLLELMKSAPVLVAA